MRLICVIFQVLIIPMISFGQQQRQLLVAALNDHIYLQNYPNIDALIIQQGSEILFEKYNNGFIADSLHDTRSAFKSITSLLAGIAIDQKLFSLDDSLGKFFPELEMSKGAIKIRHLLAMQSGLDCEEFYGLGPDCEDEMWETEDWVKFCLNVNHIRSSGTRWSYNSIDPMIVGEVITRASGMSVMEFAKAFLFEPLGIHDYRWTTSPVGQAMTAGSFYMKPIDMLKIINLVKENGNWLGHQVISSSWIEQSTSCKQTINYSFAEHSKFPNATYTSALYGFYWYREVLRHDTIHTEVLFASGNGGQYMMWIPDYDLTLVFTGGNYNHWQSKLPFDLLLSHVLPAAQLK